MTESISFDQAAEYYDATRGLPPDTAAKVMDVLVAELDGRSALEIGVGTGRIGVPLAERGVSIVGLDLSKNMLAKLVERAGGHAPFPLLMGDATRLPLADDSFDAALACHVFHLIPGYHESLKELLRVVRPGGVVLIDAGTATAPLHREIEEKFLAAARLPGRPGINRPEEVDLAMAQIGFPVRMLEPVEYVENKSLGEALGGLEGGIYSCTWGAPESLLAEAGAWVREWLTAEGHDLDEPRDFVWTVQWRAFDL